MPEHKASPWAAVGAVHSSGSLGAEVRQSIRALRRNPTLSVLGTAMLAIGMGASTLVFSIFEATLIRPLPFREPNRLVQIWETRLYRGWNQASFTEANFWDVRAQTRAFDGVSAYHYDEVNLTGNGAAQKITCISVSAGFFRTLGVLPAIGNDFPDELANNHGSANLVILGHRFWKSRFGGNPSVLGKTLRLNDHEYTVLGVLPAGEPWINNDAYIPLLYRANANRKSFEFEVIGRLAHGVTMQAARADLRRVAGTLEQAYSREDKGIGFRLGSSRDWAASETTRRALWVLLGAVSFLLLIACVNIANLLLARGMSRRREIAVRTALGASRVRLVRLVIMESAVISGLGAALGLGLAYAALRGIQTLEIAGLARLADAKLNVWVIGFAILTAVVCGLLAGIVPALQAPADRIASVLRDGERQTGSRRQGRLRSALVVAEVALSFLLLVGAGLLVRSFTQLMNVNRGFQTDNRLMFSVSMPGAYWENGAGKQFLDRFFAALRTMPQVITAGAVNERPLEGGDPGMGIAADTRQQLPGSDLPWAGWRIVSPGYFDAVGLPLLKGRLFDERDQSVWAERGQPAPQRRVVISQRLAKLIFPGEEPVGQHAILWKGQSNLDAEVVGVVGDMRERGLSADPTLTVYLPYGRNALTGDFVVHTHGNPLAVMPTIRSMVAALDPNLPIADVRSFEEVVQHSVAPQRFNTILLGLFGTLALVLTIAGIYGVLSYAISRRASEIGLRIAVGASGHDILSMAVLQGMRPVIVGLAIGAIGAGWLSRYFGALLFGVSPFDQFTYLAVATLLFIAALAACWIPGRRAMRVDPATALRIE